MKKISTLHFQCIQFSLAILLSCCFVSCDVENIGSVCVTNVIREKRFFSYTGTHTKNNNLYLRHFEWNNEDYFLESNPFIDLLTLSYDCDFNSLTYDEYLVFSEEAEFIGVIGIR